jgi:phage baseplate assembly protein W
MPSSIIHSIRYPFALDRGLGRLQEETDYSRHIDQMIKQVLFTAPGERINRPDFGCGIRRMVFAPNSDINASILNTLVVQSLDRWLGDVITVSDVKVAAIEERLEIAIVYLVKARQEKRYLNLEVTL